MKRTLLIAILFGASTFAFAQNQSSTDEIAGLKKQVTFLKQTNSKLEQNIKELKKSSKEVQDKVDAKLKDFDQKLNVLSDSLKAKEVVISKADNRLNQVFHSLNLRKTVFYAIFVVAFILIVASFWLLIKRFKTINEKNEVRVFNVKETLEVEINKTKSDFQSHLTDLKVELTKAKENLEKQIKEAKK
jgi:lipopolysaccharide export LptBFGC system permease protein LptF